MNAFKAIHSLRVVHSDVRTDNILVAEDGNAVWIVDFEFAEIVEGAREAELMISVETEAVQKLLNEVKGIGHQFQNGSVQ